MHDSHQHVIDLEAEIDQLHEAIERCRKIDLASKAGLVCGFATVGIGLIWHSPLALVIAIGAVLGSLALMGSNRRTHDETVAALKEHEARRSATIDDIDMKTLSSLASEGVGKH
jgi:hypothetical protein